MHSEEERAEYYQAHKDDLEEWGEIELPDPGEKPRKIGLRITARFSPDEAGEINRVVTESGLSYTELVRKAVLAYARKPASGRRRSA